VQRDRELLPWKIAGAVYARHWRLHTYPDCRGFWTPREVYRGERIEWVTCKPINAGGDIELPGLAQFPPLKLSVSRGTYARKLAIQRGVKLPNNQ
jgi:hypothetical protein